MHLSFTELERAGRRLRAQHMLHARGCVLCRLPVARGPHATPLVEGQLALAAPGEQAFHSNFDVPVSGSGGQIDLKRGKLADQCRKGCQNVLQEPADVNVRDMSEAGKVDS
jgi:hypothetical protein